MPYVIDTENDSNAVLLFRDKQSSHVICEIYPQADAGVITEDVQAMSLARLFSVAPEMLAALEAFVAINEQHGYEFDSNEPEVFEQIRAAIAKAKGESV